jgi:hypothetical protein
MCLYFRKKALESPNATADMEVLLVYWVVFGWLSYCDFFLSGLPAYWLLKVGVVSQSSEYSHSNIYLFQCALILYLQLPVTSGVHQLYSFFHRFLSAGINGGKKDLIGADLDTRGTKIFSSSAASTGKGDLDPTAEEVEAAKKSRKTA